MAVLRILHVAALGVAALAFGVAVWGWFHSRLLTEMLVPKDLANLLGLVVGLALGIGLLWRALRPTRRSLRATIVLYVSWIAVFAWYWFNRFAVTEVHSLSPEKIGREQALQIAISIGIFLLWVALYSIGPVLTARQLRR